MPNSPRYTTISVLKTDKMKLDFVRAKRSQSLSVILGELIEQEYERLFGEKEVVYIDAMEPSNSVPIIGYIE